jgi:hypothetical protein
MKLIQALKNFQLYFKKMFTRGINHSAVKLKNT